MTDPQPRRRRRWPWILLALVVGLPAMALSAALLLLDAEALRPRLVAAVERTTGRAFTVGEMRLALSLVPTVELRQVALANPPGASRPNMLVAERVAVQAELLPLLRRELRIARIAVEQADLLLEQDAAGRGNWQFARPPARPGTGPATPEAARERLALDIAALTLADSRIGWRPPEGPVETMAVRSLTAAAPLGRAMTAQGEVVLRGQPLRLEAETGPLSAINGDAAWPVRASLALAGAQATLQGQVEGAAWNGRLRAEVPALADLAPLLPGITLPPLRGLVASASLAGQGGALTALGDLRLVLGESPLPGRPGLVLRSAELTAPERAAPVTLAAALVVEGEPLRVSGTAGTPALLLAGGGGPLPLDLRLEGQGASGTLRGEIAQPLALRGITLAVTAQAEEAGRFGLPRGAARIAGQVAAPGPGIAGGVRVTGLTASLPAAEARGELAYAPGPVPRVTGTLAFSRLDLDALRAALPAPAAGPAAPAPAPPAAPGPVPAADRRVIPATPLPLAALRGFGADLRLSAPSVTAGGQAWRQVAAHLVVSEGSARLAPLTAQTPAGPLTLDLSADAGQATPRLRVQARSPGLDLAALFRAFGRTPLLTGRAQLDADLAGQGDDLRAAAATAAGHLGLALVDGAVPRAALRAVPPDVLGLLQLGGGGDIPLRCLALRAPAEGGVLRLATLYAEGGLGRLGGTGAIDLRDETLALRLQTDLRAGSVALRAPVTVAGPWTAPRIGVAPTAAAAAGLGAFLSQQQTPDRSLQALAEILGGGGQRGGAATSLGECGPALAAARG
ncbi:AsmA family protein, partial [Falsiroseomonas selenitidurans]